MTALTGHLPIIEVSIVALPAYEDTSVTAERARLLWARDATQRWRPVSRLSATDCGDSFVFSAGEQEAWRLYSQGSERPWPPPKRCLPCRKALKVKRAGMLDVRGGG